MSFIAQQGFDVKKGRAVEFQGWVAENESALAAACPAGVEYIGTFANIFTSDKSSGSFRTIWRLDRYGSMDGFADAMKEGGGFAELMEAMAGFILDPLDGGHWSNELSRSVVDTAIWGDED